MEFQVVACPNGHSLQVDRNMLGAVLVCPTCQTQFRVPQEAPASAASGVPAAAEQIQIKTQPQSWNRRLQPELSFRQVGLVLLMGGLMAVTLARGCDSLAIRGVASQQAYEQAAKDNFSDEWEGKRLAIQENQSLTAENRREQLSTVSEQERKARQELEIGAWRRLRIATRNARTSSVMASYYHEWLFVLGSCALTGGLIAVGFTGQGADRWICLGMLAIVTFSLYVGGLAWFGAGLQPLRL